MSTNRENFDKLLLEVEQTFKRSNPHCSTSISDWKGRKIKDFQEHLSSQVQGRISEKWFYTHIKTKQEKLPREDVLDLLCEYAGQENWRSYAVQPIAPIVETQKPKSFKPIYLFAPILLIILVWIVMAFSPTEKTYTAYLIDSDTGQTIFSDSFEVEIFRPEETSLFISGAQGSFSYRTEQEKIKYQIKAAYYKPIIVERFLQKDNTSEKIKIRPDDYALMIHIFSTSKIDDWKRRRRQLDEMITNDAHIYQVYKNRLGVELYNKRNFINKLTLPTRDLKNIQIIDVEYKEGKINKLRFKQGE